MSTQKHKEWQRTHYCGNLRLHHAGHEVVIYGWAARMRDIGNLVFIDLRDREGLVQILVSSENSSLLEKAKKIRMEDVIGLKGMVRPRNHEARNPQLATGDVEVVCKELEILNASDVLPFMIADPPQASEELRFKYRYLDLRRPSLQANIRLRHQAILTARKFLSKNGFYEIETPFLTKSTPEGARDYLVPSRMYKGKFFALPQSPQIFKQLLMIAGFDRYFQVVRCFRDEDLRADRQPEFTQIDIEMSFAEREEIFNVSENMIADLFDLIGIKISLPFPCFTYEEAMKKYGTDSPDLRSEIELQDLTEACQDVDSPILQGILSSGGVVKGLVLKKEASLSRGEIAHLVQMAQRAGAKGLIWIRKKEGFQSSLRLQKNEFESIWKASRANQEDLLILVAGQEKVCFQALGGIRRDRILKNPPQNKEFKFVWITEFPLFEWDEEEKRLVSMHHPFTAPKPEDLDFLNKNPLHIRAQSYDLILNGTEIGGGSIRIHKRAIQKEIFKTLGLKTQDVEEKFGFFMEALEYGVPPHGGIAFGMDRIIMILAGEKSIREVIPFPKTTSSLCLMTGSPSPVSPGQLKELGLKKTQE